MIWTYPEINKEKLQQICKMFPHIYIPAIILWFIDIHRAHSLFFAFDNTGTFILLSNHILRLFLYLTSKIFSYRTVVANVQWKVLMEMLLFSIQLYTNLHLTKNVDGRLPMHFMVPSRLFPSLSRIYEQYYVGNEVRLFANWRPVYCKNWLWVSDFTQQQCYKQ